MLAKLFDDIGIASLIRSLSLSILLLLLVYFLSGPEEVSLSLLQFRWTLPGFWSVVIGLPVLILSSLWFNSAINAIPLFKADYQVNFVASILLIPILITGGSLNPVLMLPLVVLFLIKQLALAENPGISLLLFDSGTLIGMMLFLEPLSLIMLLVVWLGLINYGHFGLKQLLMPLTGLLAVWFMAGALLYWFGGTEELRTAFASLAELPFGRMPEFENSLWRAIPLLILLLPALLRLAAVYGKAKILQRQSYGFLLLFMFLLLIGGALFYKTTGLWIWMALPMAALVVNLVKGINKNWMKDLVYLTLLSYLIFFLI